MTVLPKLTKQALTQFLGVSRQVIDRLVSEGLPFEGDAGRQRFDPKAVARWLLVRGEATGGGPGVDAQRERLLRAQADTCELRLRREKGELVDAKAVAATWARTFTTIRDLLRAVPMSCVDRVMAAAADGRPAVKAVLQHEIDDALRRAGQTPVVIADDDDAA